MKKIIFSLSFFCLSFFVVSQEITKVAVVDLHKINASFRVESQSSRDYEQKKEKYSNEIKKLQQDILELKNKKLEAMQNNKNDRTIKNYDSLIASKTSFLQEYVATKNEELKVLLNKLLASDTFYSAVYNAIKTVAEREGYTVVLNVQEQNSGIIWYSQTIDITDLVIAQLQ